MLRRPMHIVSLVGETANGRLAILNLPVAAGGHEADHCAWAEAQAQRQRGWQLPCGAAADVRPETIAAVALRHSW